MLVQAILFSLFCWPVLKHQFYILCQDSGELWVCNDCEQVICFRCITVSQACLQLNSISDIMFEYVCYHWLKFRCNRTATLYWVSPDIAIQMTFMYWCQQGFYRNSITMLSVWLSINKLMKLSIRSSLLSHLTLVIHLWFYTISTGGPIDMATQTLTPYFPYGGFWYLNIAFDIGSKSKLNTYSQDISCLMLQL